MIPERINNLKKYLRLSHNKIFLRDVFRLKSKTYPNENHLQVAMEWLCIAQDVTSGGGVSAFYDCSRGWAAPYPETTGYIIPTFLNYAEYSDNDNYVDRAISMGNWEIDIQLPSGAVRGGVGFNDYPIVFNTGQVLLGWISLYNKTGLIKYLDAATRAADWLVRIQDDDGKWSKYVYKNITHTYHTRVAWPLFELYELTNNKKYKYGAERNILWVLQQSFDNGWFNYMGFKKDDVPLTHTIAYTLRGLLESSIYLSEEVEKRTVNIVSKACEGIINGYGLDKNNSSIKSNYLPAELDKDWQSTSNYSCITGNAQIAIVLLKLFNINNDIRFFKEASKLIYDVKSTQSLSNNNPGIKGGIAGSYPIWGGYNAFIYLNWATNFFASAVMMLLSTEKIDSNGKAK